MKTYEDKTIPESTKSVLVKTTCDICLCEIKDKTFIRNDVEISHEHGDVFPEGGYTDTDFVDLCGKCFQEKLIPWLISQGCKIQTKETDF